MTRVIHLACTTDGGFAPHTGTMLHSALAATPDARFHVHVLCADLPERDRAGLLQVAANFGATLTFLPVTDDLMGDLPRAQFHPSCWFRILLPGLLPDVARVLYLDSDIVVRGSLAPLWDTDLAGAPMAGVINPFYPFLPAYHVSHLGLAPGSPYYNSGVLLLDLSRLRACDFTGRIRAYARSHPGNWFPEQDAINALFQHDILPLHARWNAQSSFFDLRPGQLPLPRREVHAARSDPAVVHFIGPYKPWHYLCTHPLRRLYFEHRQQTPWPVEPLAGKTLRNRILRPFPATWRYRLQQLETAIRRRLA